MSYSQLTQDQRYQIYEMKHEGKTQKQMAGAVGVQPSTISRELSRNQGRRGDGHKAAGLYRYAAVQLQFSQTGVEVVSPTLGLDFSVTNC